MNSLTPNLKSIIFPQKHCSIVFLHYPYFFKLIRKHRKGLVRRIRPADEEIPDETVSTDSIVYVPADENTVYVQAENVEERVPEDGPPLEIEDKDDTEKISPMSAPYKYGVSLYNYSKTKSKQNSHDRAEIEEPKYSTRDIDARLPLNQDEQDFARNDYAGRYYHESTRQYTPDSMNSTRYHSGQYESFSPRYKKTKYYEDQPPSSFYPQHSTSLRNSKTPMYNKQSNKFKTDTYIHREKYRTMASLPAEMQHLVNVGTKSKENGTGYSLGKGMIDNEDYNMLQKNTNKSNLLSEQPPQLVHVLETATSMSTSVQEEGDSTSTFDKSPPALEKRESSFAEDDSIKVENDDSQDSVNGISQATYDTNQNAGPSPSGFKFVYADFFSFNLLSVLIFKFFK